MKTYHIVFLFSLIFICNTNAERMRYTCEFVRDSRLIGVWSSKEIVNGKFGTPSILIKGKVSTIKKFKDKRYNKVLDRILKGEKLILIDLWDGHYFTLPYNKENHDMIKFLIKQDKVFETWDKLTIKSQIENSDLIVKAKAMKPQSRRGCIADHPIVPEKTYKGKKAKKHYIAYSSNYKLNKDYLFLIQKQPGTGPNYRVMKAIPWSEADKYLKALKQ